MCDSRSNSLTERSGSGFALELIFSTFQQGRPDSGCLSATMSAKDIDKPIIRLRMVILPQL